MARGFTIRETDVYRLILDELNDNALADKIKFSFADWTLIDSEGNEKGLLINRLALRSEGSFDVKETFNEITYATTKSSFVAMGIAPLNGEFTALNTIKDVTYDTTVQFLVCVDNIIVQHAVTVAIEEVRARFIQYERLLDVEYANAEDTSSKVKTEETLKVIMMSGSIDYGSITQINGKQYLTYTLPITLQVTNFGEFANQQKIYLGVNTILDEGSVKMFLLEPNNWFYGTAKGVDSAMLLPSKASETQTNETEIKSIVKNKGFAFNLDLQMDLTDPTVGEILKHIYKESLVPSLIQYIYSLRVETYLYNRTTGALVLNTDLTMNRQMIITQNQPNEELSKGEKIVYSLVLIPYYTG